MFIFKHKFIFGLLVLPVLVGNAQSKIWTLQACIDTAISRNVSLQQGQLSTDVNNVNLKQSKENLYPTLNITDAPSFNFGKTISTEGGESAYQNTTGNSFAITSSVNLFSGFQYVNTIKENKQIYDASVKSVEKQRNDISLNILAGYLQVLVSYEAVDIAQSQLDATSSQLSQTQIYVTAGKLAESNLFQIQSQLAEDKLSKVTAENQLKLAKVNLMQLMNMPVVDSFNVITPSTQDTTINLTSLTCSDIFKTADGFLPEVKSAQLSTQASETALEVAKALYLPKLTMSGSIRTSGSTLAYNEAYQAGTIGYLQSNPADLVTGPVLSSSIDNNGSNLWNQLNYNYTQVIGFNLTIPIFNNYIAKNSTSIAKINIKNSQLNEEAVGIQLRQAIEQAYADMLAAASQYKASGEAMRAEEKTYNDMEKKFRIGLESATDYLIEKSNYAKSEQAVIQAKYTYIFKAKLINFYLGKPITL